MDLRVEGGHPLRGEVHVPADKSITHRGLLLGAIADGLTEIIAHKPGKDNFSTALVLRQLGARIDETDHGWRIDGIGIGGLKETSDLLHCGNSGTTLRLLTGLLAGGGLRSVLTGDPSLSRRPMGRICGPLREFGADVQGDTVGGKELAPIRVGLGRMKGGAWRQAIASAQVKSSLLLAGVMSGHEVLVWEPARSRDHTEQMLRMMGMNIVSDSRNGGNQVRLEPNSRQPRALGELVVPGDLSSAAFWAAATLLIPDSDITISNVGLNPTRTGILDSLSVFGCVPEITGTFTMAGEKIGTLRFVANDIEISSSDVVLQGALIPRLIDELVVLGAIASARQGTTWIRDAMELRVKEADRIAETVRILRAFGVNAEATQDGFRVQGKCLLKPVDLNVGSDHRIALTACVLAVATPGISMLRNFEIASVSYPSFLDDLRSLGGKCEIVA